MFKYILIIFLVLALAACDSAPPELSDPDPQPPAEGPADPSQPDAPENPGDPDPDPPAAPEDPAPPPDEPATSDLQGSVAGWPGEEATVSAAVHGNGDAQVEVVTGAIDADGRLSADLTSTVADALLSSLPACEGLNVSDPAARQNSFSALGVRQEDALLGRAALASGQRVVTGGLTEPGDYYVQYTYSDRAVSVQGGCPVGGASATFRYDLALRTGWNPVAFRLAEKRNGAQVLELSNGVPEGALWFFAGSQ